jgi:hypothetical protein
MNKGVLMASGAYWATIFTALIAGIVATTGGGGNVQKGIDALMVAPALGSGLMALALLKFNPSVAQVLRADLFGTAAGAAVFLISALVLGANFSHPVPYVLSGIAAAGGITIVSLLWADAAEAPPPLTPTEGQPQPGQPPPPGAPAPKPAYRGVW